MLAAGQAAVAEGRQQSQRMFWYPATPADAVRPGQNGPWTQSSRKKWKSLISPCYLQVHRCTPSWCTEEKHLVLAGEIGLCPPAVAALLVQQEGTGLALGG